jgi:S-formylglutathione hydrolase FrmB
MKKNIFLPVFLSLALTTIFAQTPKRLKIEIKVSDSMQAKFVPGGRLLVHFSRQIEVEPRSKSDVTIGYTPSKWSPQSNTEINTKDKNVLISNAAKISDTSTGKFYVQVVYKQNIDDGQENVAGNLYSTIDSVEITSPKKVHLTLFKIIPEIVIVKHPLVKSFVIQSKLLSEFSQHPRFLKAAVLLPADYDEKKQVNYPICYKIPGLNGRYNGVNGLVANKTFMDWWNSADAPKVIYVTLDSQGPYGDTYQVDSENNGPCGKALTEELIPHIEKSLHYTSGSTYRFLAGNSTGGWVAMGLQIFYPDFFNGTFSFSPDPLDFEHYGLIDIYHDETIFYNRYGYLQPGRRTTNGEPTFSMKDWIKGENLASRTGNYLVSGGQFGAYNAVFGPKGMDGLPSLMFDPITGKIDHDIAKQWEKYDLKKVLQKNWSVLGPKLQGKVYIWVGDMDGLYSNVAVRYFKMFMDKTENPKSDASINFTAMAGHGAEWSDKHALELIAKRIAIIQQTKQ